MIIDKAIKELRKEIPPIPTDEWSINTQAKALSIEALKAIKGYRWNEDTEPLCELPGETKE